LNIEKQSFEVSAFRFDRDDFRARTSGGSHKHRKQADIRTYIHTDKFAFPRPSRIDFLGQCSKFGRLVHLRGEQQVLLATVINRVQPQAHPPPIDIKRASRVFEPHRRYPAQQDREAQQASCLAFSRSARSRFDREHLAQGRRIHSRPANLSWRTPPVRCRPSAGRIKVAEANLRRAPP
jgi:hypothetical protein